MSKIELYTWSYCPYCINAKKLLDDKNIPYTEYPIDDKPEKKQELFVKTGQDSVPYVFIDGELIGGYTELKQLDDAGKLD
jgi:glutaredoxin 3